jgi:hypothetical protein
MRRIMSGLIVLAMVFTLVSISEAGCFPFNCSKDFDKPSAYSTDGDTHPLCWAGSCPDMKKFREMEKRDADRPRLITPDPMGSPGI